MATINYNDRLSYNIERLYLVDTATGLRDYQPVCWQEDPANKVYNVGFDVELPNANNLYFFAGIIAPGQTGKTGPGYVDVIIPRRREVLPMLLSNVGNISVGDPLYMQTVLTDTGNGSLIKLTDTVPLDVAKKLIGWAVESLASTASGATRNLKLVYFV